MRQVLALLLLAVLLFVPAAASASVGLDTPLQIAVKHLSNLVREEAALGVGCVFDASVTGTWGQSVQGHFSCSPSKDTTIPAKHMARLAADEATIGMRCFVGTGTVIDLPQTVFGVFLCFPETPPATPITGPVGRRG